MTKPDSDAQFTYIRGLDARAARNKVMTALLTDISVGHIGRNDLAQHIKHLYDHVEDLLEYSNQILSERARQALPSSEHEPLP